MSQELAETVPQALNKDQLVDLLMNLNVDLCRMQAAGRLGPNELLNLKVAQIRSLLKALASDFDGPEAILNKKELNNKKQKSEAITL